jgi:cytochrome c oxidase assembly protein subunit 11
LEKYLKKFECFCFTKQVLKPGEVRQMPVRFVIDPQIPVDINTVTISYTFFALEPGM